MKLRLLAFLLLATPASAVTTVRRDFTVNLFHQRIGIQQLDYRLGDSLLGTWFEVYFGPLGSVSCSGETLLFIGVFLSLCALALSALAYRRYRYRANRAA